MAASFFASGGQSGFTHMGTFTFDIAGNPPLEAIFWLCEELVLQNYDSQTR
jgi:hypothetical protein